MRLIKCALKSLRNEFKRIGYNRSYKYRIGRGTRVIYSNLDSYVTVGKNCDIARAYIGKYTYIGDNSRLPYTRIGSFTSIAPDVIVAMGMHPIDYVSQSPVTYSTADFFANTIADKQRFFDEYAYVDEEKKFCCEVGNDVWIATRATLVCGRNGLRIGDGAVIRAGALVTKDVPPYAIVQGVPAKIIGYRFGEEVIRELQEIKWWSRTDDWIKEKMQCCDDVNQFILKVKS